MVDVIKSPVLKGKRTGKTLPLNEITSYDLECVALIKTGQMKPKEIAEETGISEERIKALLRALKGKVKIGKIFDYKELDMVEDYIDRVCSKGKYKYAYNALPGADSLWVVFSKVKLPLAEPLR